MKRRENYNGISEFRKVMWTPLHTIGVKHEYFSTACRHETFKVGRLQEMKLHILLLFASSVRLQDTLKGFRFKDNNSKYRWEDGKNGMAQLNFDSFLPPSMTLCAGQDPLQ